ncbi:MAG: hypothetical protein ACK5MQ_08625 [Pikeienuella sp.]
METLTEFAAAIDASGFVKAMKFSPIYYTIANTVHVFGVALLVGAIVPMDLRLLGLWRDVEIRALARILVPVAVAGLLIAMLAGMTLFSVRAGHYINVNLFFLKLTLIATGTTLALFFHARAGLWLDRATRAQCVFHGLASLLCWLGALAAGRMIAYFPNL